MWERFSFYGMQGIVLLYMYWQVADGGLGIDSAVAAGLGPGSGTDLRALIRSGADDDTIDSTFRRLWAVRSDRYSELRSHAADEPRVGPRVEMSYIGG